MEDVLENFYNERCQKKEKYKTNYKNLLLKEQIKILKEHCTTNHLSDIEVEALKDVLDNFLYNLYFSLDKVHEWDESEKLDNVIKNTDVWTHGNFTESILEGSKSKEAQAYEKIDIESFCECARTYLQHPWLKSDTLDWIFVDIAMFYMLHSRLETIKNRNLKSIIINSISKGKAVKICLFNLVWTIASCGLRYLLPIALILYFGREGVGLFIMWTFLIYLIYKAITIPAFIKMRWKLKKSVSEWEKLLNAYHNLGTRSINLRVLLDRIEALKLEVPLFDNYIIPIISRSLNKNDTIFVWSM